MTVANRPGRRIVLASASPRRRELLTQIGVRFRVEVSDADETPIDREAPDAYVLRVARDKALDVRRRCGGEEPVLAADTAVVIDGNILGKPADRDEARQMLRRLSGRTHEVYSGIALALPDGSVHDRLNVTRVTFAPLDEAWIERYCETGDSLDKAGAYGVQGWAGEKISRIDGSFYGVMGLPLFETAELLHAQQVLS